MSVASRVLTAVIYAAALGVSYLHGQFDWHLPGGRDFWLALTWPIFAGAVGVGFAVARWWVVGLALAPVVAAMPLQLAGKVGDFHDAYPPLENPVLWLLVVPSAAFLLSMGVALRKGVEMLRRHGNGPAARPSS